MFFGNKTQKNARKAKRQSGFILTEQSPFFVKEAYKSIRTNLIFSLPEKGCKKILLTSSMVSEYKSTTAINLAISLTEYGFRVLLMDCDLRKPTVAYKLGLNPKPGISENLVGLSEISDVIQNYQTNLDVIAAGTTPPNPSELMGSEAMDELLAELEQSYDYIIIDAAPVGFVTDAVIMAKKATGYIFVVKNGVARKDEIDRSLKLMQVSGAKMLGFIFTSAAAGKARYSSYQYGER